MVVETTIAAAPAPSSRKDLAAARTMLASSGAHCDHGRTHDLDALVEQQDTELLTGQLP